MNILLQYAMKVFDLSKSTEHERNSAEKEAKLLTGLKHEFILHAVTSFQQGEELCLVTEFCDRGDLEQFLEKRNGKSLDEVQIVEWFRQICSALKVHFCPSILVSYRSCRINLLHKVATLGVWYY